mgnify:FL=1
MQINLQIKNALTPIHSTRDESEKLTCYHPNSLVSHDNKPYQVRIGNDLSKLYRYYGRSRRSLTQGLGTQLGDHVQQNPLHPFTAHPKMMGFSEKFSLLTLSRHCYYI